MIQMEENNELNLGIFKNFTVDWDRVKTLKDVKIILKAMDVNLRINTDSIPKQFKELFDNNFLKERK